MSKRRIQGIRRGKVPGGVEVSAMGRSDRGTRYLVGSIVVLRGKLSKDAFRQQLALATQQLLA